MVTRRFNSRKMMMKLVLLATALSPLSAYCGNTTGTVTQIMSGPTTNPNQVFVTTTGTNTALPACSTAGNRYVFTLQGDAAKAMYAAFLSAKLTNSTITLIGSGTCAIEATSENVNQLVF